MCFKPEERAAARSRARERLTRARPDRSKPREGTTPRGNEQADQPKVDRAAERLMAVVGR